MTAPLKITGWTSSDSIPDGFGVDHMIRGWTGGYAPGGRIAASGPWEAYVARVTDDPQDRARLECLKAYIVENDLRRGGFWHHEEGIPGFSDGTVLFLSMRAWGDLMAAIWGGLYTDFAWEH